MTLNLDYARYDRAARHLARVTGKALTEVNDGQAKLFVRDCMKATPPFTPGRNWTESTAAQFEIGKAATRGQVTSLFSPIRELNLYRKIVLGKAGRLGRQFRKYLSDGENDKALALLRKVGFRVSGIVGEATSEVHRKFRDRRGRVRNPGRNKQLVVDGSSIEKLAARKVAHVGLAKSGWVKPARSLGVAIPRWVARQAGAALGIFTRGSDPQKPFVIVGNGVPYIQSTGQELRIMELAWKNRLRNLPKQIEATLRAQAKRLGIKTN